MLLLGPHLPDVQGLVTRRACWSEGGSAWLPHGLLLDLGRGARPARGHGEGQSCRRCQGPQEEPDSSRQL